MSKGLYFNTFYTFSKAINSADTDNSGGGVAPIQNRGLEKGRAGYDRNHRFIGTINWELPFGNGKRYTSDNKVTRWLMSGLELSWIQTVESGNPLNFTFANLRPTTTIRASPARAVLTWSPRPCMTSASGTTAAPIALSKTIARPSST
jgi:hypothetical protein